jgi:FAD/FMN-containing dehydrogenase
MPSKLIRKRRSGLSPCELERLGGSDVFFDSSVAWENWTRTFKFIPERIYRPTSAAEVAAAILAAEVDGRALRAVGSGWSDSDATLPLRDWTSVKGAMEDADVAEAGVHPPGIGYPAYVVDTTFLASSLQNNLARLLTPAAIASGRHFFHVQAGVTIRDLDQLLDHESPRLALPTSGGSDGATLAGAISTSTHGGEIALAPLADYVRAIHLIGPGGVEFWIERRKMKSSAGLTLTTAQQVRDVYPCVDISRVIYSNDVFYSVLVSMGCMGVIYSVILEVVPQYGIHVKVLETTWLQLVRQVGALQDGRVDAAALGAKLMDGSLCGLEGTNRYVQLTVNPFLHKDMGNDKDAGDFDCWLTNREQIDIPFQREASSIGSISFFDKKALSAAIKAAAPSGFDHDPDEVDLDLNFFGPLLADSIFGQELSTMGLAYKAINFARDRGYPWMLRGLIGYLINLLEPKEVRDVAYKISSGLFIEPTASRSIEVAFPLAAGIHFLEDVLDHMENVMMPEKKYVLGWISLRICGQTHSLFGIQQYAPTCLIEVALIGSKAAATIISQLQTKAIAAGGILHWGFACDQIGPGNVELRFGAKALGAWHYTRYEVLGHKKPSNFDNRLSARSGLQ